MAPSRAPEVAPSRAPEVAPSRAPEVAPSRAPEVAPSRARSSLFELRTSPPPPDACSLAPGELRARGGGSSAESTRAARGRARKHVSVHILNTAARRARAPRPAFAPRLPRVRWRSPRVRSRARAPRPVRGPSVSSYAGARLRLSVESAAERNRCAFVPFCSE